MSRTPHLLVTLAAALAATAACGDDSTPVAGAASEGPSASFAAPRDGDRVAGAVDVVMAAEGIEIVPAGEVAPGQGHFHVIADEGCLSPGTAIAKDADHVHFGTGASTGTIYLDPGTHSLCLQVGDGAHVALAVTDTIRIEVGIASREEFCDVFADTDSLMAAAEASTDAWSARQPAFENARRLLAQLSAGLAHVDADVRDEVGELVHWATVIVETMASSESEEAAAEQLWGPDPILPTDVDLSGGERWVLDTCGVSL